MNTSNTKFTTFWMYTNPSSLWVIWEGIRGSSQLESWRLGSRNTSTLSQPSTAPVSSLESDQVSIWVDWPFCQVPALLTQCLKRARTWWTWSLEESDGCVRCKGTATVCRSSTVPWWSSSQREDPPLQLDLKPRLRILVDSVQRISFMLRTSELLIFGVGDSIVYIALIHTYK
jgi:hypothetical protein